jgi:hypothetical protein
MSRKMLVMVGVLLTAAIVAPALSPAETGLTKGVKLGLNMANVTGSDAATSPYGPANGQTKSARYGLAAGLFVGIGLPVLPVEFEIQGLYSMKGVKYEWGVNSDTYKLDYLDIPVLVKYVLPLPGPVKPCLFAGPSMGILLSADREEVRGSTTTTTTFKDNVNSTDIGLVLGVGVGLPLGISVDVRYAMGLTKIGKDTPGYTAAKTYNGVLSLMVGKSF